VDVHGKENSGLIEKVASHCVMQRLSLVVALYTCVIYSDQQLFYTYTEYRSIFVGQHPHSITDWRILLEQTFTAHIILLTATSAFRLERRFC